MLLNILFVTGTWAKTDEAEIIWLHSHHSSFTFCLELYHFNYMKLCLVSSDSYIIFRIFLFFNVALEHLYCHMNQVLFILKQYYEPPTFCLLLPVLSLHELSYSLFCLSQSMPKTEINESSHGCCSYVLCLVCFDPKDSIPAQGLQTT